MPPAEGPTRLRISAVSGHVTVTAEERADIAVDQGVRADNASDGAVEVRGGRPSASVEVRCPTGAAVIVGTTSGNVRLAGRLGSVSVTTASGSIRAGEVASADLRTRSGKVEVEECGGRCRVSTTSGGIVVGQAGEAEIATISGTIHIERVDGAANVRTVSGAVTLGSSASGPVGARTVSGSVTIRLPRGVRPAIRASGFGKVRCACEEGEDVTVDVASVGGDIEIVPS
jgi:DUF4097 and DUF4098 domain-containing protein YvlB